MELGHTHIWYLATMKGAAKRVPERPQKKSANLGLLVYPKGMFYQEDRRYEHQRPKED